MRGKEIGTLLRMCRERKGMSQEELARYLRKDRSAISRIENGHDIPDIDEVIMWAEATDSREFIALMLTGSEGWKRLMRLEIVFKQMSAMLADIGA
ncbi:helix-turn-helix domain-containing protein [Effusibacillus pohliae]|uniref:helix-turn-helix domain-containing protein n=1 Tax=Effusibacillus pohliae TaxID=232270 RepID=UPI00037C3841|nr:helix-turn-helix transcriptional regulator [Effusibacillus pohliae]